ncbi:hypothetical protein C6497_09540 [Candidatus Poribacteria bacterium]|nr:MAG: hypothetical protein C6497_09540 [Candidatus Poribacteria bacterium]
MSIDTVTLPPGHYVIADPNYFKDYEPYAYFWTGGDGGFYDNFDNCYYVDSAKISVFQVEDKLQDIPEGTHYFFFKTPWRIDFDQHALLEQIRITTLSFKDISPDFFEPMVFDS